MNSWQLRLSLMAVCLLCGSIAYGLEYKKNGTWDRTPAKCCDCGPVVQCNFGEGCHNCCGCGCAHGGYCNWCGHGKGFGYGGILPKCDHSRKWMNYYYGGGYGPGGCCGNAPAWGWGGHNADLFYNYYAPQTGPEGGVPAEMYPSPQATPSPAIQTYYTYQPWLPHEHLYEHNRTYVRFHSGGLGATVTDVEWGNSPLRRHKY